jgi:class 3 adenylate cyclase/pimeloyl-ACP methyl ester carboxylesterase
VSVPETLYATTSDGLSIAYQVFGSGPRNFVVVPGIVSHVEMGWENPGLSHLWRRLAELGRVALFDKRGTGMSDHSAGAATLDQRLDDLHAVMDAAGMEEAAVCGISEGGALAVLFAATSPDRVTHLLLHGCLAVGALAENHPNPERARAAAPVILEAIASTWGTGSGGGSIFVKGAPNDAERAARYERYSCPPSTAVELMRINLGVDLRPILHAVAVPTLVTHCSHDPAVPVWHGRLVAESIEGARFVEIDGDWHTSWNPDDMGVLADRFEEFVTGRPARERSRSERVLAAVMFTDIVRSTDAASMLGDEHWIARLDAHDMIVRREVETHRGRVVKMTGDGVLATFDGPGRAIDCARSLQVELAAIGVDIRVGLHAGEIEERDGDVGGLAVHIAARICRLARADEILVSPTLPGLVAGAGFDFVERGQHELKGVPGEWRLFAVDQTEER